MRFSFGNCQLDTASREFVRRGEAVHLSPKAFDLLRLLIEQRPRVVSKAELMQALWPDTFVVEGNLPVLVAEVREALGDRAEAAKVINFLATDPEAGNILQVERGVPPSARMRGAILAQLDEMAKAHPRAWITSLMVHVIFGLVCGWLAPQKNTLFVSKQTKNLHRAVRECV